jgi:hypothetical protein
LLCVFFYQNHHVNGFVYGIFGKSLDLPIFQDVPDLLWLAIFIFMFSFTRTSWRLKNHFAQREKPEE